jgi:ATP-dependent Lon protease
VLPLRDTVAFPHTITPLFVGRKKSILALEEAMRSDTFILLATQKNASDDDPATEAIYEVGTLASVPQLLKLPDGTVKVLVEGAQRAKVVKYTDRSEYYEAEAVALGETTGERVEAKDTTTPMGKLVFQLTGAFAEFERTMIRQRIKAGLKRAVAQGVKLGRPKIDGATERKVRRQLAKGIGILKVARSLGIGTGTVQRISGERAMSLRGAEQ